MKFTPLLAAALGLTAVAFPATAGTGHVQVVAASPAQGSKVSAPRSLSLTFNEAQQPNAIGVSVVMTAMPGMANHGEMIIRNFTQACPRMAGPSPCRCASRCAPEPMTCAGNRWLMDTRRTARSLLT